MRDAWIEAGRNLDAFVRPRDEVDPDASERELVRVINDMVKPVPASVWLRQARP